MQNVDYKAFRAELQQAVEKLEKKWGMKLAMGTIRYDDNGFRAKLSGTIVPKGKAKGKAASTVDSEKLLFEKYAYMYEFSNEDYGRALSVNGRLFTLVGINPRMPKNCCEIKCTKTGKIYKASANLVTAAWVK